MGHHLLLELDDLACTHIHHLLLLFLHFHLHDELIRTLIEQHLSDELDNFLYLQRELCTLSRSILVVQLIVQL